MAAAKLGKLPAADKHVIKALRIVAESDRDKFARGVAAKSIRSLTQPKVETPDYLYAELTTPPTEQLESNSKMASQPPSAKWFIVVLTAVWPVELTFACILAPSVAVVVWSNERDLVQLLGMAVLGGAVAYIIGFIILRFQWWHWLIDGGGGDGGGGGCEGALIIVGLGLVLVVYYVLVASICRHSILPIVFRIAGISGTQIPSVFGKWRA